METTTGHHFSVEKAIEMYWMLRRRGQSGLLARLSVEACYVAPTPQLRHALHTLLGKYDELPATTAPSRVRQIADAFGCNESTQKLNQQQ